MPLWRERYPKLATFIDHEVIHVTDSIGTIYLKALDESERRYGMEGVEVQLLYISNNLKRGNKETEKALIEWSKTLKADRKSV